MSTSREARPLRWLHLSDLHLRDRSAYEHGVVLDALVAASRDAGTLAARRPALVFCTGDVAHGGKPDEYRLASRFFADLAGATGIPRDAIFVVPGNHDLDRGRVSKSLALHLDDRE